MARVAATAPPRRRPDVARETDMLSRALARVLAEQRGPGFADRVAWLHRTAGEVRAGDARAEEALASFLRELGDDEVEPYIRACTLQLQLANIAEERERIRRRRQYDASGALQRESLAETAELLQAEGVDAAEALRQLQVDLVLTAHPTEATRRSVLDHQADLTELLDRLDDPRTGHARRRALLGEVEEILTIWWQTDVVRRARPRVDDEVRRNLFFFESTLFDAVPEALAEVERAFRTRVDRPVIAFGSWAGSDMDGHPEVGAETLARTLRRHRQTAVRSPSRPRSRSRSSATRRSSRARRSCAARTSSGSRCAPSSASSSTGSTTRCAHRATSPATRAPRSCAATSRWCATASAPSTSRAAPSAG